MAKDWPPTGKGDLNRDGALYLTDSFRAAAQWACYGKSTSDGKEAGVIEFEWNGPSAKVYPYSKWGKKADYENYVSAVFHSTLVHNIAPDETDRKKYMALRKKEVDRLVDLSREYDMFEGPMDTAQFPKITNGFWQYAVVKKTAFEKDVKMVAGYKVDCSKIPDTKSLPLDDTQGPVAKLSKDVTKELALEEVEV
ncbi:hypothetical protein BDZ89DRAFT_1069962 [Hymenopellis radicata]|nr:hypothetical protein BDZ89DRAFT_1069962 [Hymenopellis radicata]